MKVKFLQFEVESLRFLGKSGFGMFVYYSPTTVDKRPWDIYEKTTHSQGVLKIREKPSFHFLVPSPHQYKVETLRLGYMYKNQHCIRGGEREATTKTIYG